MSLTQTHKLPVKIAHCEGRDKESTYEYMPTYMEGTMKPYQRTT